MSLSKREQRAAVQEEWLDEDGYWIALKSGYQDRANPICHTIHEDTKREAWRCMSAVEHCDCRECEADKKAAE